MFISELEYLLLPSLVYKSRSIMSVQSDPCVVPATTPLWEKVCSVDEPSRAPRSERGGGGGPPQGLTYSPGYGSSCGGRAAACGRRGPPPRRQGRWAAGCTSRRQRPRTDLGQRRETGEPRHTLGAPNRLCVYSMWTRASCKLCQFPYAPLTYLLAYNLNYSVLHCISIST